MHWSRVLPAPLRPAQRLAIRRDNTRDSALKIGNPGPKSLLKRPAVKPAKDRANGLGRGYAVLKDKK
jgi:hypothetical protein